MAQLKDLSTVRGTLKATVSLLCFGVTGGIGYGTGAGGTVTQGTSKSTTVVLSRPTGIITTHNATLNADAIVSFTVTNTTVAATDHAVVTHESGGTIGAYTFQANTYAAGSFKITITNISTSNLSEALVLRVSIIKSVNA